MRSFWRRADLKKKVSKRIFKYITARMTQSWLYLNHFIPYLRLFFTQHSIGKIELHIFQLRKWSLKYPAIRHVFPDCSEEVVKSAWWIVYRVFRVRDELLRVRDELLSVRDELLSVRDELLRVRDELLRVRDELFRVRD